MPNSERTPGFRQDATDSSSANRPLDQLSASQTSGARGLSAGGTVVSTDTGGQMRVVGGTAASSADQLADQRPPAEGSMPVHDVAAYILEKAGPMTAMKLQKLAYYSQAWSLVWDEEPLFTARIEAWANGPVVPQLYDVHRGQFTVSKWPKGNPSRLTRTQRETVDTVLDYYDSKSSQWLSELTHREDPWRVARGTLALGERGTSLISHDAMAEYYGSLI